jgi:hypothetical protein
MEQQFLNAYIENMGKRLGDFAKSEVLLSTQLEIARDLVSSLTEENTQLKQKLEKLESKKINKTKEVNTSSDTF